MRSTWSSPPSVTAASPCLRGPRASSLFCLGAEAQGVSIQGGQYPLDHGALSPSSPWG
ncbi:MAG: hypothetical protein ACLUNZ_11250 [Evtepia sp.]